MSYSPELTGDESLPPEDYYGELAKSQCRPQGVGSQETPAMIRRRREDRRSAGQMVDDAEADRQAARDGYNPNW